MTNHRTPGLSRRTLLKRSAAGAVAAAFASPFFVNRRLWAASPYATQYLVYVMYSGGVRTYETWNTPSNIPRLYGLKSSGALHTQMLAPSNGHDQAKQAIVSGSKLRSYDRRNYRNDNPSLYEYVRKSLGIPAWDPLESTCRHASLSIL